MNLCSFEVGFICLSRAKRYHHQKILRVKSL